MRRERHTIIDCKFPQLEVLAMQVGNRLPEASKHTMRVSFGVVFDIAFTTVPCLAKRQTNIRKQERPAATGIIIYLTSTYGKEMAVP